MTLDCSNTVDGTPYAADCQIGNGHYNGGDGTLSALFLRNPEFTPELLALPQTLAELTADRARAHVCVDLHDRQFGK